VTTYHGEKVQFWVPTNVFVQLLVVGDEALYGMARPWSSIGNQQWFTDYAFKVQGRSVVGVSVKSPQDEAQQKSASLSTLEILIDQRYRMDMTGNALAANGSISVKVERSNKRIGMAYKNIATIQGKKLAVKIFPAVAKKYRDKALRVEHIHLDMHIVKVDLDAATGVLPEIWGIKPISDEVKAFLHKPHASEVHL